jgi:hypothetical protein
VLWGAPSARLTVAPGTSKDVWVAFYSTGPAETATLAVAVASPASPNAAFARTAASYYHLPVATITLPARPAAPMTSSPGHPCMTRDRYAARGSRFPHRAHVVEAAEQHHADTPFDDVR